MIFAAGSKAKNFGATEQREIAAARVEIVFDSVGAGMVVNWGWLFQTCASAIAAASRSFVLYQPVHSGPNLIVEHS